MKNRKLAFVMAFSALLLVSLPAHAQFGRFKDKVMGNLTDKAADKTSDKASDKLGLNSSQGANPEKKEKGSFGEAKATLAPGVKKSANVARQSGGTPVAQASGGGQGMGAGSGGSLAIGGVQVASFKIAGTDARQFDAVRGYGACNKLSNFQILSASQVKVSIDLTAGKSGGTCQLYFRSGGETVFMGTVALRGK